MRRRVCARSRSLWVIVVSILCPPLPRFAGHRCCAGVELKNVKMSMNPFCENAMEEAVKLKVR